MPMHLVVDASGRILSAGRTIRKVLETDDLVGCQLFDIVQVTKPRGTDSMDKFVKTKLRRMQFKSLGPAGVTLRAVSTDCNDDAMHFISTSIAADFVQVIEALGLKSGDFSPADSTIDLVFSMQMQTSVLNDARQLAQKINQAKVAAERSASTDELTGLANRRALIKELDTWLERMGADGPAFSVMQIDLDRFKLVNDTLGHLAGDTVLLHVAEVLRGVTGANDFVCRIGGDEFVVLLAAGRTHAEISHIARRIIDQISLPIPFEEQVCKIGASVGVTCPFSGTQSSAELLTEADLALYESKRNGRGRYYFFAENMRMRMNDLNRLSVEIGEALEREEFQPYFQPQIGLQDGRLIGCEMLARWHHPVRGILEPADFLFAADQANQLFRLDQFLMERSLEQIGRWTKAGLDCPGLSLNVTVTSLADHEFPDRLKWLCEASEIPPEMIGLEILESVILGGEQSGLVDRIQRLGDAGFRLILDDFGTDRASISYLRALSLDKIKIDRSFVAGIDRDLELQAMTGAMLDLASRLGIGTIAEGIETEAEARTLVELGCEAGQGFLLSRPLSTDAMTAWLAKRAGRDLSAVV